MEKTVAAPKHLSREARRWWMKITANWNLDDSGMLLLEGALESFDRMRQAQAVLRKEGLTVAGGKGQLLPHPCCGIENAAKSTLIRHLKALNLDLEPLRDAPGRPPGTPGKVIWKRTVFDAKQTQ